MCVLRSPVFSDRSYRLGLRYSQNSRDCTSLLMSHCGAVLSMEAKRPRHVTRSNGWLLLAECGDRALWVDGHCGHAQFPQSHVFKPRHWQQPIATANPC